MRWAPEPERRASDPGRATRPFSFGRLFAGTWLGYASYGVLLAVLPLAEIAEGGGPLLATLVIGAPLLAQTLAAYGWGALADRTGARRVPLVLATLAEAPLFAVFPLLGPGGLFAVRIAQSALFGAIVLATTQATEDPRASAAFRLGRLQLATSAGMLSGVAVTFPLIVSGSFRLASTSGVELSALLAAVTVASALVFASAGDLPGARPPARPSRFDAASHGGVFYLAGATAAVSTARYVAVTAIPVYLAGTLAANGFFTLPANATAQLAIWVGASSALNLLAAPVSGRWAERSATRHRSLFAFALLYAAIWSLLAAAPTYAVTFGVWILPVAVFFTVAGVREAAEWSAPAQRGRAVGLLTAAFNLGGLLGGAAAGLLLAAAVPGRTVFVVAAVGSFAAALLFLPPLLRRFGGGADVRTSAT
jgi:MFS family permease